jgi:hypothetical protein
VRDKKSFSEPGSFCVRVFRSSEPKSTTCSEAATDPSSRMASLPARNSVAIAGDEKVSMNSAYTAYFLQPHHRAAAGGGASGQRRVRSEPRRRGRKAARIERSSSGLRSGGSTMTRAHAGSGCQANEMALISENRSISGNAVGQEVSS